MRRESIAACLIVQDERERLPAALESVAFCDEVIVVDGGSTDGTVAIARECGALVIENPWPGFARQRNVAIDAAKSDWVLEVDADERISSTLRASIEALLSDAPQQGQIAVFALRNRFLGRPLGPSAKYPAYRTRLFRRGAYRHDESRDVHEGIVPRERPIELDGDLEHELAATVGEALADVWSYARLESGHIDPAAASKYAIGIVVRPLAKLAYRIVLDGGWRDGWRGVLKIVLDVMSDSLVWLLVMLGQGGRDRPLSLDERSARTNGRDHFGRHSQGPPKVVAVACGADAQTAGLWLAALSEQGIDVALIADDASAASGVPVRVAAGLRPAALRKALEVEMDLRVIDGVVAVGRRARLMCRLMPPPLRPMIPALTVGLNAAEAADRAHLATVASS